MRLPPVLALTQGDPAGIGPEIVLRVLSGAEAGRDWRPLLIVERAAIEALRDVVPGAPLDRLDFVDSLAELPRALADAGRVAALDPVGRARTVVPGRPTEDDARGAMAALDLGARLALGAQVDALVTAPINKAVIARWEDAGFRGHTDHLAAACGLERYGRDYLMAFLAPDLRVALLSTHLPLAAALAAVSRESVLAALRCLHEHGGHGMRIAVAGLNPHAGENGLLGLEDEREIRPAVAAARGEGIDAHGPESADSLFARARRGEFDWVLALYHDQGLIALKTAAFGAATNWTLGLPFLRTSVDHGTAYDVAGKGTADAAPLAAVIRTTLRLLEEGRREASAGGR